MMWNLGMVIREQSIQLSQTPEKTPGEANFRLNSLMMTTMFAFALTFAVHLKLYTWSICVWICGWIQRKKILF
jgi:hypothetical protein